MDQMYQKEMIENFQIYKEQINDKIIFLFGHCEASLTLANLLIANGFSPEAILDNNINKLGQRHNGIPVISPTGILNYDQDNTIVFIVTRLFEEMKRQLQNLGYNGRVIKLVDYNTYAEYSLSGDTRKQKQNRVEHGIRIVERLEKKYKDILFVFCPYNALGDVYFCISYLPEFMGVHNINDFVICVPSESCADVARLFGVRNIEVFEQKELDATIQAIIYTRNNHSYIAHHDRPYVINLHKALRIKMIPLEQIYRCGVMGLSNETAPMIPTHWETSNKLSEIVEGRTVILSPYAKSITAIPLQVWAEIVDDYRDKGFTIFTNVHGNEKPLLGTRPLNVKICEMKSILEKAGTFIGIRSGLCDVIKTIECRKIALYPEYKYCDTRWDAIDMYSIEGFDNVLVGENDSWEILKSAISNQY